MFKFPGFKENYFLGIDFGTSSIKIVELVYKKSGVYLSNYGWVSLPVNNNASRFTMTQDERDKEVANNLRKLIDKMNIESSSAHISMGAFKGLSTLVEVFGATEDDMDDVIKAEANKYIPVSLDEVYLSWDIVSRQKKESILTKIKENGINKQEQENKSSQILLVAAPKEDVHRYEKIVDGVGLEVDSLELDIFSVVRSLIGNDLGTFLVIDMGAKITNIMLVKKGVITVNRNINVGGNEITKNIMSNLNISWSRAEEFKKRNNYLSGEGKMMIDPVTNIITKEARRIIELDVNNKKNKIDNVLITGGGIDIVGIDNIFSDKLGIRAMISDPWKKIIIENTKLKNKNTNISSILAVATGLALKGVGSYKRN